MKALTPKQVAQIERYAAQQQIINLGLEALLLRATQGAPGWLTLEAAVRSSRKTQQLLQHVSAAHAPRTATNEGDNRSNES